MTMRSGTHAWLSALLALLVVCIGIAGQAQAACTNPVMLEGSLFYNADQNVPQACVGGTWVALGALNPGAGSGVCSSPSMVEGSIFYNDDHDVLQYCDGANWIAIQAASVASGGCIAPADCNTVGEVCDDGSLFAGFVIYNNSSCEPLFVTDDNQSSSSQWNTATGTDDITDSADNEDAVDGWYNRDNRGGGTFPAFELCESNTYHGKSDWYLPARAELNLLWLNHVAIDTNAVGNFMTDVYWSSTEGNSSGGWSLRFSDGKHLDFSKDEFRNVRCVRRD